jgi:RNA polymerase sigma-B factor
MNRPSLSPSPSPARDALIESHLPLARSLAHRYRHHPEPIEDLVQVAALGLVKAAHRFDPGRGFAFSSFAVPTILGELRRYFRDATWDVRPPRRLQETTMSVERAWNAVIARTGREPTLAELADHLGWPASEVAEGLLAMECRRLPSLDAPAQAGDDDAISVGDAVGGAEPGYAHVEARDAFDRLIAGLDARARTMLRLRFEHSLVQAEIGARLGCSQMQVSRIIRRSLEQISGSPALRAAA